MFFWSLSLSKIPNYKNIIVGKVLEIYDHPDADKIRVTKVDVGSKIYEIVCGAWNFDVGAVCLLYTSPSPRDS